MVGDHLVNSRIRRLVPWVVVRFVCDPLPVCTLPTAGANWRSLQLQAGACFTPHRVGPDRAKRSFRVVKLSKPQGHVTVRATVLPRDLRKAHRLTPRWGGARCVPSSCGGSGSSPRGTSAHRDSGSLARSDRQGPAVRGEARHCKVILVPTRAAVLGQLLVVPRWALALLVEGVARDALPSEGQGRHHVGGPVDHHDDGHNGHGGHRGSCRELSDSHVPVLVVPRWALAAPWSGCLLVAGQVGQTPVIRSCCGGWVSDPSSTRGARAGQSRSCTRRSRGPPWCACPCQVCHSFLWPPARGRRMGQTSVIPVLLVRALRPWGSAVGANLLVRALKYTGRRGESTRSPRRGRAAPPPAPGAAGAGAPCRAAPAPAALPGGAERRRDSGGRAAGEAVAPPRPALSPAVLAQLQTNGHHDVKRTPDISDRLYRCFTPSWRGAP